MRIETIEQAVNRLEEVACYYFGALKYPLTYGNKKVNGVVVGRIVKHDGTVFDPCIIIDEWLIISPVTAEESFRTIGKNEKVGAIWYQIEIVKHNFGVHYFPDGSGEPPSDDIVPYFLDKPLKTPNQAIEKALHIMLDNYMEGVAENLSYIEIEKEEET